MPVIDEDHPPERPWGTYAWRVFHNVYNYSLLGATGAVALITGAWWLGIVAAGAEALWILYAPDSRRIRDRIDASMDKEEEEQRSRELEGQLLRMSRSDQARCRALVTKQREIASLANDNKAFTGELLKAEIPKLQKLVDSFIDLASSAARFRDYLDKEDIGDLDRLAKSYEKEAASAQGPARDLAKKNQQIVLARLARLKDIKEFVDRASGQLELIENSFGLLADQIVSMRSPAELSSQLDDLIDGVEAVRETAKETDQMLQTTGA